MHTIRQTSGLAGFPKRDESKYNAFGAGHSSTSISAGQVFGAGMNSWLQELYGFSGMAVGRDLLKKKKPCGGRDWGWSHDSRTSLRGYE